MIVKPEIEVFQNEWELAQMVDIVERLEPASVLEVGSWQGGTLWHWLQIAGTVVAIDDRMQLADEWREWASDAGTDLHLLPGSSHDHEVIEQARELGPYDFVFIDADHRYEAVRTDWESFSPMVAPGGVLAFHDTLHPENSMSYGVGRVWAEITSQPDVRWVHIAATGHCGIGLVWL